MTERVNLSRSNCRTVRSNFQTFMILNLLNYQWPHLKRIGAKFLIYVDSIHYILTTQAIPFRVLHNILILDYCRKIPYFQ